MKKKLAAFGATVLGLGLVGAGAAAPAAAADTTEPCADMNAQLDATGSVTDNWYQDCVPQYGVGKAEFSIVADEDDPTVEFPEGFVSLEELPAEAITSTSDMGRQQAYLGDSFVDTNFIAPIMPFVTFIDEPTVKTYFAAVVAPITSIGSVPLDTSIPAAATCATNEIDYAGAWVAEFGAVDTTFNQTINGEEWNYRIAASPLPTYFFGTFPLSENAWCVTDGETTYLSSSAPFSGEQIFGLVENNLLNIEGETPEEVFVSLGVYGRYFAPAPIVPAATLPATGAEVLPLVIAAGSFTAFGLALLGFVNLAQRRRSRV